MLRNPLVLAVVARSAPALAGLAGLAVGVGLAGLRLGAGGPDAGAAAAAKLVAQPALVAAAMALIPGIDPVRAAAMTLTAAAAMITVCPPLGARFAQGKFCAVALLPAMLGASATLPI
ncbi:MAG: hypothetical protein ACJA1L_002993 [Paracoccaceae bacterium]